MAERGDGEGRGRRTDKAPGAFRTISEVAAELDLPAHVLSFWEGRFPQIRPLKRGGGRRYYRPGDVELLRAIRRLLYGEGYTIRGVQRLLREQGPRGLVAGAAPPPAPEDAEEGEEAAPAPPSDRLRAALDRALDELAELREILRRRRL